jgi:hypothetical protein
MSNQFCGGYCNRGFSAPQELSLGFGLWSSLAVDILVGVRPRCHTLCVQGYLAHGDGGEVIR